VGTGCPLCVHGRIGTTLYVPVAAKGALFQAGDGHAAQGHGEVDITALEGAQDVHAMLPKKIFK
jgi:acetamidase/formamidase